MRGTHEELPKQCSLYHQTLLASSGRFSKHLRCGLCLSMAYIYDFPASQKCKTTHGSLSTCCPPLGSHCNATLPFQVPKNETRILTLTLTTYHMRTAKAFCGFLGQWIITKFVLLLYSLKNTPNASATPAQGPVNSRHPCVCVLHTTGYQPMPRDKALEWRCLNNASSIFGGPPALTLTPCEGGAIRVAIYHKTPIVYN